LIKFYPPLNWSIRENLENHQDPRKNRVLIADQDWIEGKQAARLW
jgi:hypothetical protein